MRYADKIKKLSSEDVWDEYCGFFNFTIDDYMNIQRRLMIEQMKLWNNSGIGRKILKGRAPQTIDEFRKMVPLTTYDDYADVLLGKRTDMLPVPPTLWLQTTWEGGKQPIKVAPYTDGMLETFKNSLLSISTVAARDHEGNLCFKDGDKVLFALAPMPFVTGLFPIVLQDEIDFKFLPSVKEAHTMSFSQRNKKGFSMGMQQGIDLFFGLSSVVGYVTENFASSLKNGGGKSSSLDMLKFSPKMLYKIAKAKYVAKKENRDILPRDLFDLKGLICAGTDTASYKKLLEDAWGIAPVEAFAGTELSVVGTETYSREGMVFFPDADFYEFIPEDEMLKNMDDTTYVPKTLLMNELVADYNYELVITNFKGGAFARYRIGDMFRCVSVRPTNEVKLPRLTFADRVPSVIDIAGFTRITERSINDVVNLSGLAIEKWVAKKEFDERRRPYMHMYVELDHDNLHNLAASKAVLKEHLGVYFSYFDSDYTDLRKMLGIEPLKITVLKSGTIKSFEDKNGRKIRRMNPSFMDMSGLLNYDTYYEDERWSIR